MDSIREHRTFYLFEGFIFILLGILAIALPGLFTLSIELLIGWLLIISGLVLGYRTFKAHGAASFFASLLGAIFYLAAGILMLIYPLIGVLSLTIILIVLFLLQGIVQIVLAFQSKPAKNWGWFLFSGIISLLLAFLIWSEWPGSAVWVIGLLVGVNLIFWGIAQVSLVLGAKE